MFGSNNSSQEVYAHCISTSLTPKDGSKITLTPSRQQISLTTEMPYAITYIHKNIFIKELAANLKY